MSEGASKPSTKAGGQFPGVLRVYLEVEVKQALIDEAQAEQMTLSSLVRKIIRHYQSEGSR